jgi:Outer membrane protein beta-barrel domain
MKVVKIMFFSLCLIAFTSTMQAQKVGIRAGINISNVSGDADTKPLTGFYAGVFKEITLMPELLFLQPELQYSMQGYKIGDTKVSLGYLNIPVLAKVYVAKTISLEAGPQIGFKVNDNVDVPEGGNEIKTFDTAFVGGLGWNFPFGLGINARYAMGLSEIVKDSEAKNQVIQLGASFKF